ncbi:hypothetical protein PISMIDRAFT_19415 [Pisolithus microcarpus 441]|uniref:Uncharacterized protein n=1 Tax=Pisolithus microcarpus 441 TaxID=765257 RepID=A0A0C9YCG5_9AGAM|nr:hypothetical protein PISMIDRAFT_19415 [Pisolithus microcarpus 441]
MFFGSGDSAEFQVEVHPSSYLMDQEIEDNADEEDKCALARAYAQVVELKNAIKRKKPARFNGVEILTRHPHNPAPSNPALANSTPQFRYQSSFDEATTTKHLMSQVLGAKIEISTQDLLAVSSEIRKQIKEMAMMKKIAISSLETALDTSSSLTWASYEQYLVKDTEGKCVSLATTPLRAVDGILMDKLRVKYSKENTAAAFLLDYTAPSVPFLDPYDSSFVSSKDPFLFSTSTTVSPLTLSVLHSTFKFDPVCHVLKYKPVAKKVRPIPTATPVEFRVDRREVGDPLTDLPVLPYRPPPFVPGSRFMAARAEELDLDPAKFLWPSELELV